MGTGNKKTITSLASNDIWRLTIEKLGNVEYLLNIDALVVEETQMETLNILRQKFCHPILDWGV